MTQLKSMSSMLKGVPEGNEAQKIQKPILPNGQNPGNPNSGGPSLAMVNAKLDKILSMLNQLFTEEQANPTESAPPAPPMGGMPGMGGPMGQ